MLLLAAGRGQRFGGDRPKAFVECAGRTLLERSLARLAAVHPQREIVLAVHPDDRERYVAPRLAELQRSGLDRIVDGGATRQDSMRRALESSASDAELVLVHDAARPFFPVEAAREALRRAREVGAACLAIPAPDTLKRVDASGRIAATLERSGVWLAQTPQVAQRRLLLEALDRAQRDGWQATDDVSLLERAGFVVEVVRGSARNLKITTLDDLGLAVSIAHGEDET